MENENLQELAKSLRPPGFPGSYFISFEGIEGAGKSSQIAKVSQFLDEQGFNVMVLREPGGTSFGERLRSAILNSSSEIHPLAEAHLFASSRAQLLSEVTLKELDQGNTIVIYDRYIDSSIAYQGVARGLGIEPVLNMHQHFPLHIVPHKTFYLRIPLETSYVRQQQRNLPKDYFESKGTNFYENLIKGYDAAADLFPERIEVIDGNQSEEVVFESIKESLLKLVQGK
jgi:dTMP kinase